MAQKSLSVCDFFSYVVHESRIHPSFVREVEERCPKQMGGFSVTSPSVIGRGLERTVVASSSLLIRLT